MENDIPKSETLRELVEKITSENVHDETDFGVPVGDEILPNESSE